MKRILPDAHTDFIFAVTGEEFGIVACLFVVALFAFIVMRGLVMAARNDDPFCRFAAAGLVMMFGIQSAINMAVNLHLMPAKGMTLPFISYGGSSLISLALGIGFLIAVTRKRPRSRDVRRRRDAQPRATTHESRPILLAAGGTGGHLFPAEALSDALSRAAIAIELVTDERAQKYGAAFPARAIHSDALGDADERLGLVARRFSRAWRWRAGRSPRAASSSELRPARARRLWRLSDACRRCWRRRILACRRSCTSRTP